MAVMDIVSSATMSSASGLEADLQATAQRHNSMRARLNQRKQQITNIKSDLLSATGDQNSKANRPQETAESSSDALLSAVSSTCEGSAQQQMEQAIHSAICNVHTTPVSVQELLSAASKRPTSKQSTSQAWVEYLHKLVSLGVLRLSSDKTEIVEIDRERLQGVLAKSDHQEQTTTKRRDQLDDVKAREIANNAKRARRSTATTSVSFENDDVENLLREPTAKEKESLRLNLEIMELLQKPTYKEMKTMEKFRSDGTQMKEFCPHGTRENCSTISGNGQPCQRLHFRKIIQKHTDESLGDCSFLNTCYNMSTCKYIHYEIDYESSRDSNDDQSKSHALVSTSSAGNDLQMQQQQQQMSGQRIRRFSCSSAHSALTDGATTSGSLVKTQTEQPTTLFPPQWLQCDLRFFDLSILGKFSVVMADPPWDIHMELPYGTMSDDEMRSLNVQCLQDEGLIFLWVTGRAMELGRECLRLWGYEQCEEIIWVKTNQLQRIIRTGRTGHWLNHGKEHCLVGIKGPIEKFNRGLDCDVIVAEVRATSHKPDEIYGLIERLSPSTRKVELFGRQHNVQPNWITLGNQLDGVRLLDPNVVSKFQEKYPDGNCMPKPEMVLEYKQKQMIGGKT